MSAHSLHYIESSNSSGLRARLKAGCLHLVASATVAALVVGLIYFCWYPEGLHTVIAVGEVLVLILAVDVVIGPVLTFVVFDRRKRSLSFDLAFVVLVQLCALAYGIFTVEAGRPHYLVFVKDRFEVVSRAELRYEDRVAGSRNRFADVHWFAPRIVAAENPSGGDEQSKILFESLLGGRDVQHFPALYRDYDSLAHLAAAKGRPLSELRELNPGRLEELDRVMARSRRTEATLRFLPIKGPHSDAAMLLDATSGAVVGVVPLRPWE